MVPGIIRKELLPGMRRNGILVESLFVDIVQIERRHLPMLNLGVINKQPHSFSTTTIVNDAYPSRSSPSPMTTTNHDPERSDTPTTSTPHPKTARTTQQRHVTTHSSQTSAWSIAQHSTTSLSVTWQTTNNDISRRSSSQVSTHPPFPSAPYSQEDQVPRRRGRRGYQTTNDDDVVVRHFW